MNHGQQQALTQATICNPHALSRKEVPGRRDNSATRQHQSGALLANRRQLRAAIEAEIAKALDDGRALLPAHPRTIDDVAAVAFKAEVHSGKAGHGA